jgi:hypothetical protein
MTRLLAAAGVLGVVAGLVVPPAPWFVLWGPGVVAVIAGYVRHTDPRRRAQRRARARRGYIRGAR